ncbi:MAG: response regulator [Deltaproteobacteria bacterium]|nr:response regulator [Deltaproteobacteria bacterium]
MVDVIRQDAYRSKVLLVDDEDLVGKLLRRLTGREGDIDFHHCRDGRLAVKTADELHPTVILQDLMMPEIDGLELVRRFRENPGTREVPLVVLSGKNDPQVKAQAFSLGANDYLVKFPEAPELLARIRYHSMAYIHLQERNEAFARLERAHSFIRRTFGRYVSEDVAREVLESPEGLKLGGEKRVLTILMADLKGFTLISETLPPQKVVALINDFLEAMTEPIHRYGGTINEFLGDAILAFFGAPRPDQDHAAQAVACALEMQRTLDRLNTDNLEKGLPEIRMGIGINTGEVVLGNFGSVKRTKYGAVGKHVNLVSRIESYTVGGQVLISQSTLDACGPILRIEDRMVVSPKGIRESISLYEVGGIGGAYEICLPEKARVHLLNLKPPPPVEFSIIEGKQAGAAPFRGQLVRFGGSQGEILSDRRCRRLTDLKIRLFDSRGKEVTSDLYAKVTREVAHTPPTFRVHFTACPPEARSFFTKIDNRAP